MAHHLRNSEEFSHQYGFFILLPGFYDLLVKVFMSNILVETIWWKWSFLNIQCIFYYSGWCFTWIIHYILHVFTISPHGKRTYLKWQYQKPFCKVENHYICIKYIDNCNRVELLPRYLEFWISNNDLFNGQSGHEFQNDYLKKNCLKQKMVWIFLKYKVVN